MSSIEVRENRYGKCWRVRFRHEASNRAVTFATLKDAEKWRWMLDNLGPEIALPLAFPKRPSLDRWFGRVEGPRVFHLKDASIGPCVYLLWHRAVGDRKPAYVGATTNILRRLGNHLERKAGEFDRVTFIKCADEDVMWEVESHLIAVYRPWLNKVNGRMAS